MQTYDFREPNMTKVILWTVAVCFLAFGGCGLLLAAHVLVPK